MPLISFTGGTKTAQYIITDSAPQYKKLGLELGGKNPNIIFDDADLTQAVPTRYVPTAPQPLSLRIACCVCVACVNVIERAHSSVRSSFANQGEICLCGSRIFVQKGIYDKFVQQFVEAAKQIKVSRLCRVASRRGSLCVQNECAGGRPQGPELDHGSARQPGAPGQGELLHRPRAGGGRLHRARRRQAPAARSAVQGYAARNS